MFRLLGCIAMVFSIGCTAYFNTFYNADRAYKEGLDQHTKLLRNYPDSLVVTPPADISGKYDRAIEKAVKMIETFPKAKKWHDDALLLMGKAHFYKMENERAVRCFRQLEHEFPKSDLLAEAYLYTGMAYIESDNLDKAEEILQTADKRFPHLNDNQQITILLINIVIRREGTAELYIDLKQYDKAIILLKKAPRKKKFPFRSFRIDRSLFSCYRAIDSLQLAYDLLVSMLGKKLYYPYSDELFYYQGLILNETGKTDEAIRAFKKLTSDIDTTTAASDTSSFKARALVSQTRLPFSRYGDEQFRQGAAFGIRTTRQTARRGCQG